MSVAIIGMGCLFPKASDLKEFWRLLYNGEDGISDVPDTHWSVKDYFNEKPKYPDHTYCRRGGFLSPVSYDPSEFGIPPKILEATDTAQLLSLLVAKRALEDAGYGDGTEFSREKTSVIIGVTGTQELVIPLSSRLGHPIWRKALEDSGVPRNQADDVMKRISDSYVSWQESSFPGLLGNVVAGRIANRLDLGGTNCIVDAACASSTSALNLAVLELLSGKCDMSITGGVDTLNDIFMHMCFSQTGVLSFSSDIRPFSEDADGTVLGEGIGLMVLKRLDDAEKDGDRIYAVIKSVGSSSDGRSQSIYAPNAAGQVNALKAAYQEADIDPATVELIEAHGTGTRVGDAVEFSALKEAFKDVDKKFKKCAVGSVKSNIGHTKAAAGAAGIIKAALALHHKVLPPTLKVGNPDPKLDIDNSNFYLNTHTRPWFSREGHPRRSGVSSFGFGGSNFHVVLEEYKKNKPFISWTGAIEIVAFSAKTKEGLYEKIIALKIAVANMSAFSELAFKAYETRNSFSSKHNYRLLIVIERPDSGMISDVDSPEHLLNEILENLKKNESPQFNKANIYFGGPETKGKLAFIFPGQGSQYCNMGNDLACCLPEADEFFQKAKTKFIKEAGSDTASFTDLIFPLPGGDQKLNETNLRSTNIAQPAIGCTSLLMLKFLDRFGVKPDAVCGHSFGELTALYAAGKIDEDTFLSLAVKRGQYMADAGKGEKGAMLAVNAPLDKINRLIEENNLDVVLANRNSPDQGVLSGSENAIAEAMNICKENGFRSTALPVAAAFHSRLVKDAAEPFKKALTKIKLKKSDIPVFSNTTGDPYPEKLEEAVKILGNQILNPVNFVAEIEHLYKSGIRTFLEVGPKPVLSGLVKSILKGREFRTTSLDKSSGRQSGIADFANALCFIAANGHHVDFTNWEDKPSPAKKQKMSIPISGANYRSEYEIKPPTVLSAAPARPPLKESLPAGPKTRMETRTVQKQHISQPDKFASGALMTITESLKSLQTLQIQTAETHKKFLETQSEASKNLQKMLDRTRYTTESAASLMTSQPPAYRMPPERIVSEKLEHVEPVPAATPVKSSYPEIEPPRTDPDLIVKPDAKEKTKASPVAISGEIEKKLIEVVSDLTGYPEEMIELDMDIESDLGIDSIKRVEILSAFENKMPELPSVSADVIGSLKTLKQILDYISGLTTTKPPGEDKQITPFSSEIENVLLDVVSELTGYPVEMIELDMDIESDLGIDSIKRVEILSAFENKMPELPSVSADVMGSLKTLQQVIEYIKSLTTDDVDMPAAEVTTSSPTTSSIDVSYTFPSKKDDYEEKPVQSVDRRIVSMTATPGPKKRTVKIPADRTVFITDDKTGLGKAIADILSGLSGENIKTKLVSPERISDLSKNHKKIPPAGGFIIIPDVDLLMDRFDRKNLWNEKDEKFIKQAFAAASHLANDLCDSASEEGAVFATITRLDGCFGFKGDGVLHPLHGALAGIAKTAAIEWEDVCCHAIDISPDWKENDQIAMAVVNEIFNKGPVEIGLDQASRYTLKLETSAAPEGRIDLTEQDVVVITGGARGVTAACAYALAKHAKPVIALLGRSPLPETEPDWLVDLNDDADIKMAILKNDYKGLKPTPAQLGKAFKRYTAAREITRNMEKLITSGATISYHQVDVRDPDAVASTLNNVRKKFGEIRAIIHGAGVLEDRLIKDKTPAQFENVFDTKAKGLNILLQATRKDKLKYIVLFSSVSARMGNTGQADYAAANEVLNKIARQEACIRKDCRVISINWGPWDGGMVSPSLKQEFKKQNIGLIPINAGAMSMLFEMMGDNNEVEVVLGATMIAAKEEKEKSPNGICLEKQISIDKYPILASHQLNNKPVVPFALMLEWFAHSAIKYKPGHIFHGIDDMRLLSGIKLDDKEIPIKIISGETVKEKGIIRIPLELRNNNPENNGLVHSKAIALLTDNYAAPPVYKFPENIKKERSMLTVDEAYEKILFHGKMLHGIKEVTGSSSQGMIARVLSAPKPEKWLKKPESNEWLADPLVIDSAFQMAILWCYENAGLVSLPVYFAEYRQYRRSFPEKETTAVLEIREVTGHKMKGDFTFLDSNNVVVATIAGYESVMDKSLIKAFKP